MWKSATEMNVGFVFFFFQAEDGIRDLIVTGVQTCALPISAKNGLSVRRGHSLLAQMVASGEVPFAVTVYNFTADQLKRQGAPLEWFTLSPAIAHGNGFAVIKRAPHPHAALLYYEFMIGDDGQRILAERKSVPTSRKIRTALDRSSLKIIDPVVLVDQGERWAKLYEEIILKGGR